MVNGWENMRRKHKENGGLVITSVDFDLRRQYDHFVDNPEEADPSGSIGPTLTSRIFARIGNSGKRLREWLCLTGNGDDPMGRIEKIYDSMGDYVAVEDSAPNGDVLDDLIGTYDDPRIRWMKVGQRVSVLPNYDSRVSSDENAMAYVRWFDSLNELGLPLRDYESMNFAQLKKLAIETKEDVFVEIGNRCSSEERAVLNRYATTMSDRR